MIYFCYVKARVYHIICPDKVCFPPSLQWRDYDYFIWSQTDKACVVGIKLFLWKILWLKIDHLSQKLQYLFFKDHWSMNFVLLSQAQVHPNICLICAKKDFTYVNGYDIIFILFAKRKQHFNQMLVLMIWYVSCMVGLSKLFLWQNFFLLK